MTARACIWFFGRTTEGLHKSEASSHIKEDVMGTDYLLHGHEYMYDLDWLVKVVKRHSEELAQIDQKIADAIKIGLTDERIKAIVEDIISNASGVVNVKIPPDELTPATGDGSANDTAAIQGCIDYVHNKGYGVVFFPAGKYLVNDLTLYDDIGIVGMGRYTTTLTAGGGSANWILGGPASRVSICQIGLNGNMSNQVDNIDGISLTGDDFLFEGLLIEQCYEGINLTMQHGPVQATDILIDRMGLSGITLIGGHDAVFKDVWINNISSTTGQYAIECQAYDSSFTNVHINSVIPVGFVCGADSCVFEGWITGVTTPVRNTGNNNQIKNYGIEKVEAWDDSVTETTSTKTLNVTTTNINGEAVKADLTDTLWYKTPVQGDAYNTIPMKSIDGTPYNLLVENEHSKWIGSSMFINAKEAGAIGDGVTDDTEALQNALNIGDVFIPSGTYLINGQLNVKNRRVIGNVCSFEYATRDLRPAILLPKQPIITMNSTWEDLTFYGGLENGSLLNIGLFHSSSRENIVDRCKISGFQSAIENYIGTIIFTNCMISQCTIGINSPVDSRIQNCFIMENDTGIYLGNGSNGNIIEGNKVEWNGTNNYGINIENCSSNVVVGNLFDRNGTINIRASGAQYCTIANNMAMRSSQINEQYINCTGCIFSNVLKKEHQLDDGTSPLVPPIGLEIGGCTNCIFGSSVDTRTVVSILEMPTKSIFPGMSMNMELGVNPTATTVVPYAEDLIVTTPTNLNPQSSKIGKICIVTVQSNEGAYQSLYLLGFYQTYVDVVFVAGLELPEFKATQVSPNEIKIEFNYPCNNKTARFI